jgi:hypothetical protein
MLAETKKYLPKEYREIEADNIAIYLITGAPELFLSYAYFRNAFRTLVN